MDVGTVQSPAVNVTMPGKRQGRRFPQQNQAVSADGVPIGANGGCCGTGVPAFARHCDVYCSDIPSESLRILQIQGFVMLRDPCLFLRKSHSPRETFGGINMDLSALLNP